MPAEPIVAGVDALIVEDLLIERPAWPPAAPSGVLLWLTGGLAYVAPFVYTLS